MDKFNNMSRKVALITGITGQDGSYLAEFLLSKGYEVHGIIRRASTFNTHRIDHIYVDPHEKDARLFLHYGDLADPGVITEIIWKIRPDEIYNLAAQSYVKVSFDMPEYTGDITGLGATRILEAIRRSGIKTKLYQASSSEMFGDSPPPQNEESPMRPRSPYAVAKLYAYWMTRVYRDGYNIFASNGILFNHESPRRGETFITRKITRAVAHILAGKQKKLYLGNLYAKRDWGFAPEYVEAMWMILQQDKPEDFVVGTGESHSVKEFAEKAFEYAGVEIEWKGSGIEEKGIAKSFSENWSGVLKSGQVIIEVDPRYFRPIDVGLLRADISKARRVLGWEPRVTFDELIKIMVDYDMMWAGLTPPGEGINISKSKGFHYTNHDFSFHQKIREFVSKENIIRGSKK
jgi:GDPmannose 4,6-dehydratase